MKKFTITALLVMLSLAAFSQKYVHRINHAQAEAKTSQFGIVTAPIIGELGEISPNKVIDSVSWSLVDIKDVNEILPHLQEYKEYAIAYLCNKTNCDILINPLCQVRTNAAGNVMTVTVTGFPAKYKKFRPATENDKWMLLFTNDDYKSENKIKDVLNKQ